MAVAAGCMPCHVNMVKSFNDPLNLATDARKKSECSQMIAILETPNILQCDNPVYCVLVKCTAPWVLAVSNTVVPL